MAQDIEYSKGVQRYLKLIRDYDARYADWRGRVEKITKRYRDEGKQITQQMASTARMNILWANVQTIRPAMFSALPKPDVFRRWRDNDPVGRVAANVLERALEYELDQYDDFAQSMESCVMDRLLSARGTCWVRYEPTIVKEEAQPTDDEAQPGQSEGDAGDTAGYDAAGREDRPLGDNQEASGYETEGAERVSHECAPVDYVHWKDFGHEVARTWPEVSVVWRVLYMTREALEERFGEEVAKSIPIDANPNRNDTKAANTITGKDAARAKIYEIWDKSTRKACWISKAVAEELDERDDPLGLDNFFPCPRPLYGTLTNDELVPVPDFVLYQDLANELDIITDRIDGLIRALKVTGCYNNSFPEIQRLFTEAGNTDLVAIKDWASFAASEGLSGALDLVDLKPIYEALQAAYEARKECIDQIYQITGIGDLMRFDNDPQATATAEKLKGQYGSLRLRHQQKQVVRFATEIIRLKAEIICSKFQPEMLAKIGGVAQMLPEDQQYVPQAIELLRNNVLREFRVEVSSDALVQMDEAQEKSDRVEFLKAVGDFMTQGVQAVEAQPEMAPVIAELFKFGVTAFKVGKGLEGMLDQAIDQMKRQPPQKKSDPEQTKAQASVQIAQAKAQADTQTGQARIAAEVQGDRQKAQIAAQLEAQKQQLQERQAVAEQAAEARRDAIKAHLDAGLERQRQELDARMGQMEQHIKLILEGMRDRTAIEVAEINHGSAVETAQISAANRSEART